MKALLVSDIHANIFALEAIWKQEKDSDVIYCAGDLVDYGPYPKEVIQWVQEHNVICVKGNHDEKVAAFYRNQDSLWNVSDEERKWAHDNAQKLDETDVEFLENLPYSATFTLDAVGYSMQHMYKGYETIQSLHHYKEFWEHQTVEPIKSMSHKTMIFGHTHRRCIHHLGNTERWINPGSVSYRRPDDPDKTAHYMTITDGRIDMRHVKYDRSPLLQATLANKLNQWERDVALVFFG
ncbi:metallophosphoesterase family protein [Paenibacillus beijingensis]|uniref:Metallophosphoesterase n=1 Tax=Paenibacillus beijingensis TaxID=1126833 RepID=A0A0D5NL45_9BACL|nr:metallophosphoesterase family protein [Paenibacillus beijingensis]AJY75860.1 metallophosphoesterase [Paenibacillus beijingensis]